MINYINNDNYKFTICQAKIMIYISDDYNSNKISLFSLYTHLDNIKLYKPKNKKIYGVLF